MSPDNAASRRLFTRAGYGRMVVERDHVVGRMTNRVIQAEQTLEPLVQLDRVRHDVPPEDARRVVVILGKSDPGDARSEPPRDLDRQVDLPKMESGGLDAVWFSIYQGQRDDFVDENLYLESLETLRVNFMVFYDLAGNVRWAGMYDLASGKAIVDASAAVNAWKPTRPFVDGRMAARSMSRSRFRR